MRRRRKTKYTWLPALPVELDTDQFGYAQSFNFTINAGSGVSGGAVITPLSDIPQGDDVTGAEVVTMAEAIGSEYFLKRIVGKVFFTVAGTATANGIIFGGTSGSGVDGSKLPAFLCTAGFYVAPEEHPAGSAVPMGFTGDSDRYNPQTFDASREPWIWRRSWLLAPAGACCSLDYYRNAPTAVAGNIHEEYFINPNQIVGLGTLPSNNTKYGSVLDGPHVDAKTARRVRQHERLFFTAFAAPAPFGSATDDQEWDHFTFNVIVDCRYLGALRRARNRSSFE